MSAQQHRTFFYTDEDNLNLGKQIYNVAQIKRSSRTLTHYMHRLSKVQTLELTHIDGSITRLVLPTDAKFREENMAYVVQLQKTFLKTGGILLPAHLDMLKERQFQRNVIASDEIQTLLVESNNRHTCIRTETLALPGKPVKYKQLFRAQAGALAESPEYRTAFRAYVEQLELQINDPTGDHKATRSAALEKLKHCFIKIETEAEDDGFISDLDDDKAPQAGSPGNGASAAFAPGYAPTALAFHGGAGTEGVTTGDPMPTNHGKSVTSVAAAATETKSDEKNKKQKLALNDGDPSSDYPPQMTNAPA